MPASYRFLTSRKGASALAYGLAIGLISVVALGAVTNIGQEGNALFSTVGTTLDDVTTGANSALPQPSASASAVVASDQSCRTLKDANPSATSGTYTIDPDGSGGDAPFDVWCDMTTDGGGWTLISAYTGSSDGNIYGAEPGFNITALQSVSTASNAKLSNSQIYALVAGRSDATFRAVTTSYDTLIERTDGGNPFDPLEIADTLQCKQVSAPSWTAYTIASSGCQTFDAANEQRVSTWVQGCNYVGLSGVPPGNPCGNGHIFSVNITALNRHQVQWIDAGYTSGGAVPGNWFVR